ncbi:MAG: phage tail family protein [Oscillospiraceae bacterium]|nr:phage tail family protein [Oscillospiraceae bacterium]
MRIGFRFKGLYSGDFEGVTVKTSDRPIRPETKDTTYSPTNADGEQSFAAANFYGHEYYEDKIFQMEIGIAANDIYDLQNKLTKISTWIMGRGTLIFDDTPLVKWDARIIDTVAYAPEYRGRKAKITVKYRVKPFGELVFDTLDGPYIDDALYLDSEIPLDIGEYFTLTGAGEHNVINIGDMPVRPVITVTGAEEEVSLECNGITLTVPYSAVIDCERYTVTDEDGNSLMTDVSGDFPELLPGGNIITVTSDEDITITVNYEARFIHNADFDKDFGWED